MKNTVIILASGEQTRWESDANTRKQLMYAGPETIIDRIVRQVRERGQEPIIITHHKDLMRKGVSIVIPRNRRWKVESLLDIKDYAWGEYSTLVLLGDVIYQGHVMNRIMNHDSIDMFFGNYAEIFAWYFHNNINTSMWLHDSLNRCINHGDKGTLHTVFRAYINNFDIEKLERKKDASRNFTHVTGDGGYTRDIDTIEEYDLFIKEVIERNKLDDLPRRSQ
jgi:hypothetical protein